MFLALFWPSLPLPLPTAESSAQIHQSSLDLGHLGPEGKNLGKCGDPGPDWKVTPGVKPAVGSSCTTELHKYTFCFIHTLPSTLTYFFVCGELLSTEPQAREAFPRRRPRLILPVLLAGFGGFPS